MSSPAVTTISSDLFGALIPYLQGSVPSITDFLNSKNVNPKIVAFVAQALNVATGQDFHMQSNDAIPLTDVITPFLPNNVTLPSSWSSVAFTDLYFTANAADKSMAFGGTISPTAAFGGASVPFTATFTLAYDSSSGTSGSLSGTLTFAGSSLDADYEFEEDSQTLTATWSAGAGTNMDMRSVLSAFGQAVPASFQSAASDIATDVWNGLELTEVTLTADLSDSATQVSIEAQCGWGSAFVVVERPDVEAPWTLAAGGCKAATQFTDLPVIGTRLESLPGNLNLTIAGAVLVVSTGALTNFAIPMPAGETSPLGGFTLSVQPGVLVAAVLDFSNNSSGYAKNLSSTIGPSSGSEPEGQLLMIAQLPALELTVELGERDLFPNLPFEVEASLTVAAQPFSLSVGGTFELTGGKLAGLELNGSLTITDTSVIGSVNGDYPNGFPPDLPFLQGIYLYEIGAEMGFNCVTEEILTGVMGQFVISATPPSGSGNADASGMEALMPGAPSPSSTCPTVTTDAFAVVAALNVDALVPDLNLLYLNLSSLNLQDLLTAILGSNAPSVSIPLLNDLGGTNLMVYWCDAVGIMLPDGTAPTTGFRFQGAFDFWGFDVWAEIEVAINPTTQASTGASGQFYMSPVNLGGVLTIVSDGNAPSQWVLNLQKQYNFPAGGACLLFSSSGVPAYLNANWQVTLLKWSATTVDVNVSKDSFVFTIQNQDGTNFSGAIVCTVTNHFTNLNFLVSGALNGTLTLPVVVGIALGDVTTGNFSDPDITVHLDGSFSASVTIDASDGNNVQMSVTGTFCIADDSRQWTLPPITENISENPFTDLKDLAGILLSAISSAADTVFADAVKAAGSLIVTYLNETWDDIEAEVDKLYHDIVNTVKNFFGIHQQKRPSIVWLQNGSMLNAQGATITDPNDPNFSQAAIYRVWDLKRHYVPDPDTLSFLMNVDPKQSSVFYSNDKGYSADLLASIPMDTEMPSITYAMAYFDTNQNMYLSIPSDDPPASNAARYDVSASQGAYTTTIQGSPGSTNIQKTAVDPGDLGRIPKTGLKNPCAITVTNPGTGAEIGMFFDGYRRYIPGSTGPMIDWKQVDQIQLPQDSINGIPKSTDMPTLINGDIAINQGNYFYMENNQLCPVSEEDYSNWNMNNLPLSYVDDEALTVISIGKKVKKNPLG